jgi:hypothetical protein
MMVRWCIPQATLEKLADEKIENPYVLLATWNEESHYEERWLVPLRQMFQLIEFFRAGRNKIFATIVWGDRHDLRKYWLRREGRRYSTDLVTEYGKLYDLRDTIGQAEVTVEIEGGFFAKEPPKWEKKWVNYFFEDEARNQCHYRKRRLFAYPVQPFVLALIAAVVVLWSCIKAGYALVALILGRKIDFTMIFVPWDSSFKDIWSYEGWYFRSPFTFIFKPVFPLLIAGIVYVIYVTGTASELIRLVGGALVLGLAILTATWLLTVMVGLRVQKNRQEWAEREREAKREEEEALKYRIRGLSYLLCSAVPADKPMEIPRERRTATIRFLELKARMCKPFAR